MPPESNRETNDVQIAHSGAIEQNVLKARDL